MTLTQSALPLGHVLITGGAIRVGRVITLTLAKAGWDITLHHYQSAQEAKELATIITQMGRRVTIIGADFEKQNELARLAPENPTYPLTALVNNASLFEHDSKDPDGHRHNTINNEVPRLLAQRLVAQLPEGQEGAIIHILDNTTLPDTMKHYSASKAALAATTPELAKRFAPKARLNAIALGPTLINERQSLQHFENCARQTLLQRASSPQDVADAILFLLKTRSIAGQILNVDCGLHLFS